MRLNILIAVIVGFSTYALTLYLDGRKPSVTEAPVSIKAPVPGVLAPGFSFTDYKGKAHSIRDFEGKIVILNFWASWCPPCIKEFPLFLKAAKQYQDMVVFIALSSDHEPKAMQKFISKLDLKDMENVYIALDENTKITNGLFQTFRLPETILINREQKLSHKLIGANWTYDELETLINEMQ